jgi:hypothetical protein
MVLPSGFNRNDLTFIAGTEIDHRGITVGVNTGGDRFDVGCGALQTSPPLAKRGFVIAILTTLKGE